MGVAFSQNGGVSVPLTSVPSPRHPSQRTATSPPPPPPPPMLPSHGIVGQPESLPSNSTQDASTPVPPPSHGKPCVAGAGGLAQQLQQSLQALHIDWSIVDREVDVITVRFAASLLTSRLRVRRGGTGAGREGDEATASGLSDAPGMARLASDNGGELSAVLEAMAEAAHSRSAYDGDDVGPQELYVSAALRLAALQLGRDGLQRILVAFAYLANGGESREERRLRRNASSTTTNPARRAESSSQEINHFQRGAGFTGSAAGGAAGLPGLTTFTNTTGSGFNASGSTLHSLASSSSALAARRFSTAPHSQQQQQQQSATSYMANPAAAAHGGGNMHPTPASNASVDHLAYSTPVRATNATTGGTGGTFGNPSMLRQPTSARSLDETNSLFGPPSLFHRHRSVSPLNATTGHMSGGGPGHFLRARPPSEADISHEEFSYNNMLLTSMNARSTVLSPLRTGRHGELLYSASSFATLMSLSTGAGAHTGRSHRGDNNNNSGLLRSPVSPFFHSTTHWVIPQAPFGGQGGSSVGMMSANSSIPNSMYSMASPPSAPDSRRRSDSYSRRLGQPMSSYQVSRLSAAVGAGGNGLSSRFASEEANLNTLTYHLPQAVSGGGVGGYVGIDGVASAYDAAGLSVSSTLRDNSLQYVRPEAVLTALCAVFAHLHLTVDDVTNLVTLLVVAALEVQTDAQLRKLAEMDEEASPDNVQIPSMKDVRAAVRDSLTALMVPLYTKTRMMLCAAAGVMEAEVQSALFCTNNMSTVLASSASRQSPMRAGTHLVDLHSAFVPLPPVPPAASAGERNLTAPSAATATAVPGHTPLKPTRPFPGSPLRLSADEAEPVPAPMSEAEIATHVRALHDFFEGSVPLESTPNTCSAAGSARAVTGRRVSSTQRGSGARQQQQQHPSAGKSPAVLTAAAAGAAPYAQSSYSDSAAGPTSSGSMSRSDVTEGAGAFLTTLTTRTDGAFVAPTQEEVRSASSFLMDVETAFVLHYAEVVADAEATKRRSSTATTGAVGSSSLPSSPGSPTKQRLRQRSGSLSKRPTLNAASSTPSPSTTTASSSSVKTSYPWRRRSDADPDLFVQLSSNATVWPLRTRLLVRRHEYAYVYDAMASTMALLREENLYTTESTTTAAAATTASGSATDSAAADRKTSTAAAAAAAAATTATRVPHPHTPIVLIDLNKATLENGANDLQVLSGPGDVEVVSLMPSRVSRSSLANQRRTAASPNTASAAAAATPVSQGSTPNSGSITNSPMDATNNSTPVTAPHRIPSNFDDLLNCCWADAYQQDMEVYRMKGSTGTMYLLTVPAEADRVMVPMAASSPSRGTVSGGGVSGGASAAAPSEDVIQASVIHSFERNRLVRPAVLSLASTATTAAGGHSAGGTAPSTTRGSGKEHGEDAGRSSNSAARAPRVQCAYNDGNSEVLALELGSEPTRIAAYPLRLLYRGVLHHFFFPNPSARDHWYQQLLQLSWMTQTRRYLEQVAAAPHDVERFIRNRISFPTGPGAFECLDMLGAGTFGRVLLVQHKLSKRLFAMKVIRKSGFHGIRNIIEARREKKILDLLDCPYIMKIHSSFQTDSRVYMLFDYLPGAELLLHTQSAHSNHFDETTSRFYIAELAIAVEYLRVRGIVHRDIKGDNLVLDAEGHVVLTDFGFAKNIMSTSTDPAVPPRVVSQHTSCGTLAYIAPEVLCNSRRRSGYGLAVDWWSLGVVLFTFLTGYFPFLKQTGPETSQAIVSSALQFPPRPALSDDARSLLDQLLQKDPDKRITCLADLRHHRFFENFDWAACRERRLPPPLVLHKDSYRSPRTTADARQLLQDRVRRSLAWSAGATTVPYAPPSHSRRPASDKLAIKHQPQFEEEEAELKLVEQAYGSDCMPKPLLNSNDVFGPLFEQQERCGSDRDESDTDDLAMDDYVPDLSRATTDLLRRLRESDVSQDLCNSLSDLSLHSVGQEYAYAAGTGEEQRGSSGAPSRAARMVAMPTLPTLLNFSEELYGDVALAKFTAPVS